MNGWRGDTSIAQRVEHDIFYLENWSFWFDLKILWLTLFGREERPERRRSVVRNQKREKGKRKEERENRKEEIGKGKEERPERRRSVGRDQNMGKSKEEIGKSGEVRGIEKRKEGRVAPVKSAAL